MNKYPRNSLEWSQQHRRGYAIKVERIWRSWIASLDSGTEWDFKTYVYSIKKEK